MGVEEDAEDALEEAVEERERQVNLIALAHCVCHNDCCSEFHSHNGLTQKVWSAVNRTLLATKHMQRLLFCSVAMM